MHHKHIDYIDVHCLKRALNTGPVLWTRTARCVVKNRFDSITDRNNKPHRERINCNSLAPRRGPITAGSPATGPPISINFPIIEQKAADGEPGKKAPEAGNKRSAGGERTHARAPLLMEFNSYRSIFVLIIFEEREASPLLSGRTCARTGRLVEFSASKLRNFQTEATGLPKLRNLIGDEFGSGGF